MTVRRIAEETAAVMAVDPSLVDTSEYGPMGLADDISDELRTASWGSVSYKGVTVGLPRDACRYVANGWMGPDDPTKADPEWGTKMMEGVAAYLVDFIGALRRAAQSIAAPRHARAAARRSAWTAVTERPSVRATS